MSEVANISLPLFSERQGEGGHSLLFLTTRQVGFFLALDFFSIYIRVCDMGKVRDGDIPVGHLCQSGEEMAVAQKFWQPAIQGIYLNCNLASGLPCVTKPFTESLG